MDYIWIICGNIPGYNEDWVNLITTSRRSPSLEMVVFIRKSSPFMAELCRFVKYSNLPRYMEKCIIGWIIIYELDSL